MRLKLTIAYDGRPYSGWQSQPNGDTVQDRVQQALEDICKQPVKIHGSGRTDTGVHANGQIAHFDEPEGISINPYNWVPALNTKLPATIRIVECEEVPADFHARFGAKEKTYSYAISLQPVLHPLLAGCAWHLPRQLDPATLEEALSHYIGTHDFRAFAANRGNETEETDYVRTITRADFVRTDEGYLITYTGNGFLYKMVRLLTGAAIQCAQGRLRLDDHYDLLRPDPATPLTKAPHCAPPDGLTLEQVVY